MSTPPWPLYVCHGFSLLMALPSVALYVLECAIIVADWRAHFNTTFYRFFLASALNNLLFFFVGSFFYSRLSFNWLPYSSFIFADFPSWLAGIFFGMDLYYQHAENFLIFFMLLQRLTVVLWPLDNNERLWRPLFPICMAISFLLPFAFMTHLFGIEVKYARLYINDTYKLDYNHAEYPKAPSNSKILSIADSIFLVLCLCVNLSILLAYYWRKPNAITGSNLSNSRMELKLLLYTILLFVGQALSCTGLICVYLFTDQLHIRGIFMSYVHVLIADLRSVVFPAWFLLWASQDISKKVRQKLACLKKTQNTIVPAMMVQQMPNAPSPVAFRSTTSNY